jgi:hypothetical protein
MMASVTSIDQGYGSLAIHATIQDPEKGNPDDVGNSEDDTGSICGSRWTLKGILIATVVIIRGSSS